MMTCQCTVLPYERHNHIAQIQNSFSIIKEKSSTNTLNNNRLCKKLPRRELEHYLPPSQCYLLVAPLPNFWNCNDGGSPKPAIRSAYFNFNQLAAYELAAYELIRRDTCSTKREGITLHKPGKSKAQTKFASEVHDKSATL